MKHESMLINLIISFQVQKACGKPTLIHSDKTVQHLKLPLPTASSSDGSLPLEHKHPNHQTNKWVSPPDTQMLQFLASLDKSKEFLLRIANRYAFKIQFIIVQIYQNSIQNLP